jgi:hypothetical protein
VCWSFFATLPRCLVGLEACGGARYWPGTRPGVHPQGTDAEMRFEGIPVAALAESCTNPMRGQRVFARLTCDAPQLKKGLTPTSCSRS